MLYSKKKAHNSCDFIGKMALHLGFLPLPSEVPRFVQVVKLRLKQLTLTAQSAKVERLVHLCYFSNIYSTAELRQWNEKNLAINDSNCSIRINMKKEREIGSIVFLLSTNTCKYPELNPTLSSRFEVERDDAVD
jgi:hypothetical protein